jgi:hypothetical protein
MCSKSTLPGILFADDYNLLSFIINDGVIVNKGGGKGIVLLEQRIHCQSDRR